MTLITADSSASPRPIALAMRSVCCTLAVSGIGAPLFCAVAITVSTSFSIVQSAPIDWLCARIMRGTKT